MQAVDPQDVVSSLKSLELDDDELVESCVLIVKTSLPDGRSTLRSTATKGTSHWEIMGFVVDTLVNYISVGEWE